MNLRADGPSLESMYTNTVNDLNGADLMLYLGYDYIGGGNAGVAYGGKVCRNDQDFLKQSISVWHSGISFMGYLLAHEVGHNLGMSHDFEDPFGGEADKVCRKTSDGTSLNCVSCDNFYNASYVYYANSDYTSYRKLSPVTGSANDCCTGIMDYQNSPRVWSSCSVRFLEQHYESESWFQCMSDTTYCPGIDHSSSERGLTL